jgi:L-fuculose-phosphate aldolase
MLAGLRMDEYVLPEVVMSLGRIPTTAYATPGSPEGANVVRVPIRNHDAVLLDRHGVVTVGRDLLEAYYRLEKVENAAQMLAMAHCLGRVAPLEPAQVDKLLAVLTKHRGY